MWEVCECHISTPDDDTFYRRYSPLGNTHQGRSDTASYGVFLPHWTRCVTVIRTPDICVSFSPTVARERLVAAAGKGRGTCVPDVPSS